LKFPVQIADYYRNALDQIEKEVSQTEDATALGLDPEEWTRHFAEKWGLEPVEADPATPISMRETTLPSHASFSTRAPRHPTVPVPAGTPGTPRGPRLAVGRLPLELRLRL